jgi:hypothetical protein
MQNIHLELLNILSDAFTKKIRYISRINISGKHKIMVNSPEVQLGMTRSHEDFDTKNNYFLAKN